MENSCNDSQCEEKLLNNCLLFCSIRKKKAPQDKIKKIEKYLNKGADINSTDANYKNNTPLHVAVIKEEFEVVRFLLERGADVNHKNSDNQTALDIALVSNKNKNIVTILETYSNKKSTELSCELEVDALLPKKSHPVSAEVKEGSTNIEKIAIPNINKDVVTVSEILRNDKTTDLSCQHDVGAKLLMESHPERTKVADNPNNIEAIAISNLNSDIVTVLETFGSNESTQLLCQEDINAKLINTSPPESTKDEEYSTNIEIIAVFDTGDSTRMVNNGDLSNKRTKDNAGSQTNFKSPTVKGDHKSLDILIHENKTQVAIKQHKVHEQNDAKPKESHLKNLTIKEDQKYLRTLAPSDIANQIQSNSTFNENTKQKQNNAKLQLSRIKSSIVTDDTKKLEIPVVCVAQNETQIKESNNVVKNKKQRQNNAKPQQSLPKSANVKDDPILETTVSSNIENSIQSMDNADLVKNQKQEQHNAKPPQNNLKSPKAKRDPKNFDKEIAGNTENQTQNMDSGKLVKTKKQGKNAQSQPNKSEKVKNDQKNIEISLSNDPENVTQNKNSNSGTLVKNKKQGQNNAKSQVSSKELKSKKEKGTFLYQKRTGTSGLSGQLYETKLLSLILFRALYVREINAFLLATNVESMGAFDDIIFRYYSKHEKTPKIIFLQAKHRDNPAKDKFTVDELMKLNGDFSLHKYLESYIKISQMFVPDNNDDMFKGEFKNMECEFIIYTSAFENFTKMKDVKPSEIKSFINTGDGKIFQFDYDDEDVDILVQTVAKSRAVFLAKRLAKFVFKDNYNNMMLDDLIKTYHVFFARHILEVEINDSDSESQNNYQIAKFRESFFATNDSLLLAFKAALCKEVLLQKKNISPEKPEEAESILMSMTCKVPVNFGNLNFCFTGTEPKKEKKLEYMCGLFKRLLENATVSTHIVMKIDDNMVGPNEILQSTDLETYRLGGLVGNLLIFDYETKTLKFNSDLEYLSEDNVKLFESLKSEVFKGIDITKCRFDINVHRFPRLSLVHYEYDTNVIKEFLSRLVFYTNQATEDVVEKILKNEIDKYFIGNKSMQSDALFRLKGDAIFLKVHDRVQKWWKQPTKAPYLTDSCEYFVLAEQDILNSPLLSILNFTYTKTINNALSELKFNETAIQLLHLDKFLNDTKRVLSIITEENALSSIKLIQYFKETHFNDYTFIDLDYVGSGNYFLDVKSEIIDSKIKTLIVVSKSNEVIVDVDLLIKHFKGKIIVISNRGLANQLKETPTEVIVKRDDNLIGFKDLADTMRNMLLEKRHVVFQGKETPLGVLFQDESYHLINSNVLYKIINNEKPVIGNFFNTPSYDEILDFYMNEQVCRYITLDPDVLESGELNVLKYNEIEDNFTPDGRDIVLITDEYTEYAEFNKMHENHNVHWFNGDKSLVWQKSRGSLQNLLKHIHRGSHDDYKFQPVTLKDLNEKVVIVSAEPGMGKSSLLTHLAINTKNKYPAIWISKINLLENTNDFKRMKISNVNIDIKEAIRYLFRVIRFEAWKDKKAHFETIIDDVSVVGENITFNKHEEKMSLTGLNLFEVELFIHCFNNGRVILLFDGFDEICPDFANEFMQLVNILKKSKVMHTWITSRLYNVLHQLENTLETFSFTIQPLSYNNQLEFLEKIWSGKVGANTRLDFFPFNTKWALQNLVKGFLTVLSAVLCDTNNKFIGMPLHLYMISDYFQNSFHDFPLNRESLDNYIASQNTMNKVNLHKVYEQFVDVKFFKIRFGEKKPLLCINDPDIRKLIENERESFFHTHKIIAAYLVFGRMEIIELFDKRDIDEIHGFIEKVKLGEEKTGIIEQIIENIPKFVHYTFAEYFATEFLWDRLKSFHYRNSAWTYLLDTFLLSEGENFTRSFFNAKLKNHPDILNEIHYEGVNVMFRALLQQPQKLAKMMFMTINKYLENIAIFILKCVKSVISEENLSDFINVVCGRFNDSCILCIAAERKATGVVSLIKEYVKDIDVNRLIDLFNCSDLPKYNAMLVAYGNIKRLVPDVWLLTVLLRDLPSSSIVELFCVQYESPWFNRIKSRKFIHAISSEIGNPSYKCFNEALEKLNNDQLMTIFSAIDSDKKLAAHRAASEQCQTFFETLESLLEEGQFKKLCMTINRAGLTPMHYFKYVGSDGDWQKKILQKVYENHPNEKYKLKQFIEKELKGVRKIDWD